MISLPLFRAKKIDSDEYVKGYYFYDDRRGADYYIDVVDEYLSIQGIQTLIDQTTLVISFNDMTDSQGSKIFASLSEDGKGGDIMKDDEYYGIAKYKDSRFVVEYENVEECLYEGNFEAIGIQK